MQSVNVRSDNNKHYGSHVYGKNLLIAIVELFLFQLCYPVIQSIASMELERPAI